MEIPDINTSAEDWVYYSTDILSQEIACVRAHMNPDDGRQREPEQENDFVKATLHISNIVRGLTETARVLMDNILTDDEKVEVAITLMQQKTGTPVHAEKVEGVPGMYMIRLDTITIPDSFSEEDCGPSTSD